MAGHVFISYARPDRQFVDWLAHLIESHGIPVWYDRGLAPGDDWATVIEQQINSCAAVVVVMTPAGGGSKWVKREIQWAESRDKPVVPLLLAGEVWFRHADSNYEDLRHGEQLSPQFFQRLRHYTAATMRLPRVPPDGIAPNGNGARPASSVPPARARRGGSIALVMLLVLALCGGTLWGGSKAWEALADGTGSPGSNGPGGTPADGTSTTPGNSAAEQGSSALAERDRLSKRISTDYRGVRLTIMSIKSGAGKVTVTIRAENNGDEPFEVWSCCVMVEQPSGNQRVRDAFDSGTFPSNPGAPVPAGTPVTGTVEFGEALESGTTEIVLTMQGSSGSGMPRSIQFSNVKIKK